MDLNVDGRFAAGQHLRGEQRERADDQAAHHGPQGLGNAAAGESLLHQRHGPHDEDGERRADQAQQDEQKIVAGHHLRHLGDDDGRAHHAERLRRQIAEQRRRQHRRHMGNGIDADDQLEGIEGAGQRRMEGGGDAACRAASHQHPQVRAAQAELLADGGGDAGAPLGIARLHADRGAEAVADHRLAGEDDAVEQRHAPAFQRIRLDGIGHRAGAEALHHQRIEPEDEAADGGQEEHPGRGQRRRGAEEAARPGVKERLVHGMGGDAHQRRARARQHAHEAGEQHQSDLAADGQITQKARQRRLPGLAAGHLKDLFPRPRVHLRPCLRPTGNGCCAESPSAAAARRKPARPASPGGPSRSRCGRTCLPRSGRPRA